MEATVNDGEDRRAADAERARELLENHTVPPLPDDVAARLRGLVEREDDRARGDDETEE